VDRVVGMDPLTQAASGARAFAKWATDQGCDVEALVDDGQPPTGRAGVARRDVFTAVQAFVNRGVYDQLIIYFAGHGILKAPGAEIWLLSDAGNDPGEAVTLVSAIEYARSTGIPHVVFVSDACRVIPRTTDLTSITGANIFRWSQAPPDSDPEIDVYYATKPGDPAYEVDVDDNAGFGVFTACFLDLVRAPIADMLEAIPGPVDAPGDLVVVTSRKLKPVLAQRVDAAIQAAEPLAWQRPEIRVESELPRFVAVVAPKSAIAGTGDDLAGSADTGEPGGGSPRPHPPPPPPAPVGDGAGSRPQDGSGSRRKQDLLDPPWWRSSDIARAYRQHPRAMDVARSNYDLYGGSQNLLAFADPTDAMVAVVGGSMRAVFSPEFEVQERMLPRTSGHVEVVRLTRNPSRNPLRPDTAVVAFDDDVGTLVPVRQGATALVAMDSGRVVSVQQTYFRQLPDYVRDDFDQYCAAAIAHALEGDLGFMLEGRLDRSLRLWLRDGPELAMVDLLRAYALAERGLFGAGYLTEAFLPEITFDQAMLALRPSEARFLDEPTRRFLLGPLARFSLLGPQLTRGWMLFEADHPLHRPLHDELRRHLVPSLWTTFDRLGTEIAAGAVMKGIER
jgi:hypothetical protein